MVSPKPPPAFRIYFSAVFSRRVSILSWLRASETKFGSDEQKRGEETRSRVSEGANVPHMFSPPSFEMEQCAAGVVKCRSRGTGLDGV